jgi:hypothetical protein
LNDFVEHLTDTQNDTANLNYWAHWIGELTDEQPNDAFMLSADLRSWVGTSLVHHLTNRLEPYTDHLPLNLHTLHALIAGRPALLSGPPTVRVSLTAGLANLASTDCLTRTGRHQLAGLQYALRSADR